MRPIKFRIYNVLSFFEKFKDEEGNRVFLDKPQIEWDVTNYQVDGESVVLMQFTWRFDSFQRPVYEWDIVEAIESTFEVKYDDVRTAFVLVNEKGTSFLSNFNEIKVVWNIYEK